MSTFLQCQINLAVVTWQTLPKFACQMAYVGKVKRHLVTPCAHRYSVRFLAAVWQLQGRC